MSGSGNGSRTDGPLTPVLLKTGTELAWPEGERIFYVLGRNGLYVCRNHAFFRSCVPAAAGPSELEEQSPFLAAHFPAIPRSLFERIVGFFDRVATVHGSEAAVLLAWDRSEGCVRAVVPRQTATIARGWNGSRSPIGVHYEPPTDLPADCLLYGDVHSHVHQAAYASHTDREDELHAAGLHLVVGRIEREPPDLHVEAVVDGTRFTLEPPQVIEDYRQRCTRVPRAWLERVSVEVVPSYWSRS